MTDIDVTIMHCRVRFRFDGWGNVMFVEAASGLISLKGIKQVIIYWVLGHSPVQ